MSDERKMPSTAFKPGQSGNPGGWGKEKLRAYRELARKIREATDDGAKLVKLSMRVLTHAERLLENEDIAAGELKDVARAIQPIMAALEDRGWGKPVQTIDLNVDGPKDEERPSPVWSAMPLDERRRLLESAQVLSVLADDDRKPTEH